MKEELKTVEFLNKKFNYIEKTKDKVRYQYENKETGEVSILEILYQEEDKQLKKIDVYTLTYGEISESLHIRCENDSIDINYYPQNPERIMLGDSIKEYQLSINESFSRKDNKYKLENYQIELTKKGKNSKHKVLEQVPLQKNYFRTSDNNIHYITSKSTRKLEILNENIFESLPNLEEEVPKIFIKDNFDNVEDYSKLLHKVIDYLPLKVTLYDREYELITIKDNAIIYRNQEDDIIDVELYLDNLLTSIKEMRFVTYNKEAYNEKRKLRIIRSIPKENDIYVTSLCNKREESLMLNGKAYERCHITGDCIADKEGKIKDINLKLEGKFGTLNLKQSPLNHMEFVDKNNNDYRVSTQSLILFKSLTSFSPFLIKKFNNYLKDITLEEEKIVPFQKRIVNKNIKENY